MKTANLVPIVKTAFAYRLRAGRPDQIVGRTKECWAAETTDGEWRFIRNDEPGTPWSIVHIPTGIEVDSYVGSLVKCRRAVTLGHAAHTLAVIQAHEAGEHRTGERNTYCSACIYSREPTGRY